MDFQGSKEEAHHQDSATELVVGRDCPLRERSQKGNHFCNYNVVWLAAIIIIIS